MPLTEKQAFKAAVIAHLLSLGATRDQLHQAVKLAADRLEGMTDLEKQSGFGVRDTVGAGKDIAKFLLTLGAWGVPAAMGTGAALGGSLAAATNVSDVSAEELQNQELAKRLYAEADSARRRAERLKMKSRRTQRGRTLV